VAAGLDPSYGCYRAAKGGSKGTTGSRRSAAYGTHWHKLAAAEVPTKVTQGYCVESEDVILVA
jgi:hypothetical protein